MRKDKYSLYLQAFINAVNEYKNSADQDATKVILYGVKLINSEPKAEGYDEALSGFQLASTIKELMGQLTPAQFMNIFPIEKDFKGHKWETKDYFYTIDYIKTLDANKPIGEGILEFLWEYTNWEITIFNVEIMGYLNTLRQHEGHLNMMEEFMALQGMNTVNTFKNRKGEVLYVRHGKTETVQKPRSKHLIVIK
ncbi:phage infection protein [Priestia megaterium]|nr:phage infection protein [Priestia megaterium]